MVITKDRDNIIAFVMTYNSTVHRAHSRTPHQALFGWKMRCVYDTPDTLESGINNESNEVNDDSNENDNYEDSGNDSNESDDYEDSGNNNNNNNNNNSNNNNNRSSCNER